MLPKLRVTLEDDPAVVADWVNAFEKQLRAGFSTKPVATSGTVVDSNELQAELARFRSNWPEFTERFTRLHDGLVGMGYIAVLAKKRKPTSVRSYIAYQLPSGRRVLEVNSSTAYFVGADLVGRLRGRHEWLRASGPLLSVHFTTEEHVDLILQLAEEEITTH
jgi:hypothetical protein